MEHYVNCTKYQDKNSENFLNFNISLLTEDNTDTFTVEF